MARPQSSCIVTLPDNYRASDVLRFHARDTTGFAEVVSNNSIRKGILWNGVPALIEIKTGLKQADCWISFDGFIVMTTDECHALMLRLLALQIEIEAFEQATRMHPDLGPVICAQTGLRLPMAATPVEALIWAITGQQINLTVALQLRRRLIELACARHSSGIACHPDAQAVAQLNENQLGAAKFSRAKIRAILQVSEMVCSGELPLDQWQAAPLDANMINSQLLSIRGIGPWTANYTLLRGFGWAAGSLHGDVAVRNSLQHVLDETGKPSLGRTEIWLAQFAPWRSLVAAHLWANLSRMSSVGAPPITYAYSRV